MHREERGNSQGETSKLAEKFYRKSMEDARRGRLGRNLKTFVPALREAYIHWVSLMEHKEIPVLLYGEKGTGKRTHVNEYYYLQNLHAGFSGDTPGRLRVFRGDFLEKGFSRLLYAPKTSHEDVIYLEHVDLLSQECQEEMLEYLKVRKEMSQRGCPVPRLFMGTEKALSLNVMRGTFSKELFKVLTGFAIFLPSIKDRSQDIPHLVIELIEELSGKKQLPPVWLVDVLSGQALYENISELKLLLKNLLARKPEVSSWGREDLIANEGGMTTHHFEKLKPENVSQQIKDRNRLESVLAAYKGDSYKAAKALGVSKTEILKKMMVYGVR